MLIRWLVEKATSNAYNFKIKNHFYKWIMSYDRTYYNTAFLIKINKTSAIMSMLLIKTPMKSESKRWL